MVLGYDTPGVYYQRVDAEDQPIAPLRMDVAAFVGLAERGPIDTPVPVHSWRQFQSYFGSFIGGGFLAYTVRGFFENGGQRCWVVRVASKDDKGGANTAHITLQSLQEAAAGPPTGIDAWQIAANSTGSWGNQLTIAIRPQHNIQTMSVTGEVSDTYTTVRITSDFTRGTLVRLSQNKHGSITQWRVVSYVDEIEKRIYWVHPDQHSRLRYDAPIQGFDTNEPIIIESLEYTVTVWERGYPIAMYSDLSLVPEHSNYGPRRVGATRYPSPTAQNRALPDRPLPIVIKELRKIDELTSIAPLHQVRPADNSLLALPAYEEQRFVNAINLFTLEGGSDGLSLLRPYDFTGEPVSSRDSDISKSQKQRGFRSLDFVDEIATLAIPDIQIQPIQPPEQADLPECEPDPCLPIQPLPSVGQQARRSYETPPIFTIDQIYRVQAALVADCELRRDRMALLDAPISFTTETGIQSLSAWRNRFDSMFATLYYPWVLVVDPLGSSRGALRAIPPCGHIAGQYSLAEFEVGVHQAPANRALAWLQAASTDVTAALHGMWNTLGINVIQALNGRGVRIMGARTLSSNSDWRFLNVRRLMIMIEKAIDLSLQWATFEPNNEFTQAKIRLALTSYLFTLWQQGALAGDAAEEAFWVQCDAGNNPGRSREQGQLIVDVGIAPSIPFEFVVLRIGRVENEWEIEESPVQRRSV